MTTAYVYKWTHIPTLKWYVGSRTARGCHPDDGYICSSKIVKPLIKANPAEWERQIIATGSAAEMRQLEADILELFDAKNDSRSFNQSNGLKDFYPPAGVPKSEEWKEKMRRPKKSTENMKGHVPWNKGKTYKCEKSSIATKGRILSESHKKNIGNSNTKSIMTPDGIFASRTAAAEFYKIKPGSMWDRMKSKPHLYYYINEKGPGGP